MSGAPMIFSAVVVLALVFFAGVLVGIENEKMDRELRKLDKELKHLKRSRP